MTDRLFDPEPFGVVAASEPEAALPPGARPVRVVPDVSGVDKAFDYYATADQLEGLDVGSMVRVELNGRSVTGWVTGIDTSAPDGVELRPLGAVVSAGPSAELVDLARWAAHRWAGRFSAVLKTASPPRRVRSSVPKAIVVEPDCGAGVVVHRLAPATDAIPLLRELCPTSGSTLVVVPRIGQAQHLAGRLRSAGLATRIHPRDWASAAARGGVVLGARSAVWARLADLAAIVVLDEHDESLQEERNPTWHARDVAIERARRAGVPCHLVSPCPTVAALESTTIRRLPSRSDERAGWPPVEIIDRRDDEPGRGGLFSSRLVDVARSGVTMLAVLNRKGRAAMLACASCGELVRTEDGEQLMTERDGRLHCQATGEERPLVCAVCTGTRLKRLRLGVTRAAEELGALVGEEVAELSAEVPRQAPSRVVVGTEAALNRLLGVEVVAFLDLDQELLAPRYRAGEQAMAMVSRAARLVGRRRDGGRLLLQTRLPEHRVVQAALRADPDRLAIDEAALRAPMGWPPFGALAEVSGAGAAEFVAPLAGDGVSVMGPRHDGRYLVRAPSADELADLLAAASRPAQRFRVAVDPPRA